MRAGVAGDLAREGGEGILGVAGDVPPALDRLEREADRFTGGRVTPGTGGERLDARLELAVVGGGGHQGPEDLKAQACPSHARARRVVVVGHESPGGAVDTDRSGAMDPTPTGKTRAAPSSARTASGRAATSRPSPSAIRPGCSSW